MKRRILSLLLVLTLLLALPVAAAAADDHTGHKLSYQWDMNNHHEVDCDTCGEKIAELVDCDFENGVCKFCGWECRHVHTAQSYDAPVTCSDCGKELPQLAKAILDKVELTTQGYEYGKAISGLQLVASQEGVTASVHEVRDPNQGDAPVTTGTFDEQNYKVWVDLVPETGYELGENCVVTLNGKADSGDNIFLLDLPARSFTVTFVTNYGTAPNPQTVQRGGNATEPKLPDEEDHAFKGWYTDRECITPFDFAQMPINNDITLYAKWVNRYTVFYKNGGHGQSTMPANEKVEKGKYATRPTDPTEKGWIFKGWYEDDDYIGDVFDFEKTQITHDITLTARWAQAFTVKFDTNGHGHGTVPADQTVEINGKAAKPTDPTDGAYSFQGWYTTAACTTEFDFNTPITVDTTLYAKWDEIYTVTFNVGDHGTAPAPQKVENGGKATKPENPTAKGWRFDGWYTDERCTAGYDFDKAVTANTTLYAKWTQLFTLTFETNGGTKIDSVEAPDGSLVYLGSYKPTKSGYYFVGWYTDKNLTRESRVGYVRMDGNKTVYAKFAVADKTNPKTADPALPGLALAVLSFSTVGLAALGIQKRK